MAVIEKELGDARYKLYVYIIDGDIYCVIIVAHALEIIILLFYLEHLSAFMKTNLFITSISSQSIFQFNLYKLQCASLESNLSHTFFLKKIYYKKIYLITDPLMNELGFFKFLHKLNPRSWQSNRTSNGTSKGKTCT
ncbi:hypothetical protein ACJX0J_015353, partial [Zea mays]